MQPLLEINNLTVSFGDETAVDGIDLTLNRGQTLVLLGESGSGKSITAMTILQILPVAATITSGQIVLAGQDLLKKSEEEMCAVRGGQISIIFQEPQTSLNPVMTIGDQIAESLRIHKNLTGTAARKQVIALLDEIGITSAKQRYDDYPHQFSGGMKQRVMIAMALACDPVLLIADEPSTALDVTIQKQVLELLLKVQQKRNMAILFITHDLGVAAKMADHVSVMHKGNIVENASRDVFFTKPSHRYSQALFNTLAQGSQVKLTAVKLEKKPEQALLKVTNLDVFFPIRTGILKTITGHVKAVKNVSLTLEQGKTTVVVGESGSGKSSLGKGILQLVSVSGGEVLFDGVDLMKLTAAQLRQKRADIQIIFQDPYSSMNPRMQIGAIIEEGMILQSNKSAAQRLLRIEELLIQVGLEPASRHRYPHQFSGGQRQRICIARALAVEPKLIICDEPTSALDSLFQAQILELLSELQNKLGLSYLFITHNLAIVEQLADHVIVMYQGEIVEQGDAKQILHNPQHAYTQQLISAVLPPTIIEE
ncbi:MAG: ABC transporter ATP-binding protein [Methylophaga sp.]|nr:MAG: ABC transporter ATP-binding protein [Methylophaga sp.]